MTASEFGSWLVAYYGPYPQPETISRAEAEKELEKALGKKVRIEG